MHQYRPTSRIGFPPATRAVKWLVIVNAAVFFLHYLLVPALLQPTGLSPERTVGATTVLLAFTPALALGKLWLWQFVTYMFVHLGFFHIAFNMLVLWILGTRLEQAWGWRAFLKYFFVTGVGAALFQIPFWNVTAGGASGAVYGVLVGFAMVYPEQRLMLLFFPVPIKSKHLVIGLFAFDLLMSLVRIVNGASPMGPIAHMAHVGGAVVGWLYLKRAWRVREFYQSLRWRRRRKRFTVIPPDPREDDEGWYH
jgi:membrane associated rhomboid family serine protease